LAEQSGARWIHVEQFEVVNESRRIAHCPQQENAIRTAVHRTTQPTFASAEVRLALASPGKFALNQHPAAQSDEESQQPGHGVVLCEVAH